MFLVTGIRKEAGEPYGDVIYCGDRLVERRPAPVLAFFQVEALIDGKLHQFDTEIRFTIDFMRQIEWSDDLGPLIFEHSKKKGVKRKNNESLLADAIINVC